MSNGQQNPRMRRTRSENLPFIQHLPVDGRRLWLPSAFYDDQEGAFHTYIPHEGELLIMTPRLIEGTYVSKSLVDANQDCFMPLTDLVMGCYSFPEVIPILQQIEQDLVNALASLEKYFVLLQDANQRKDPSSRHLVSVEVEYAFANHRAFYDRLQAIINAVHLKWNKPRKKLPDSFREVAQRDAQYLRDMFSFPETMITFYRLQVETFMKLRDVRDNIFHHGHSVDLIFHLPDGFGVALDDKFVARLANLNLWSGGLLKNQNLGSILALLQFLVRDITHAMHALAENLPACSPPPPQRTYANGYRTYFRCPLVRHVAKLDTYRDTHWLDPQICLQR